MIARRIAQGLDTRSFTLQDVESWPDTVFGGTTHSGEKVSVDQALSLIPVFAAVNVIASGIGVMPCQVYRRLPRGRDKADDIWQYRLLHEAPNPEMAPGQFFELMTTHMLLWGNVYLEKVKGSFAGAPRVMELWPITPSRVQVSRSKRDGRKLFEIDGSSGTDDQAELAGAYDESKILHITGLGYDGTVGLSPVAKARHEIGGALSRQKFQGRLYQRGANIAGVIERPKDAPKWSPEAANNFKTAWRLWYEGSENAGGTPVLQDGMAYKPIGMPLRDQQFIEQNQFTTTQIATLFNIPASKINGSTGDSLTYGNRESDALAFVTDSLLPWMNRISQGLWRDNELFPSRQFYPEFVPEALLKGNPQARAAFYEAMNRLRVLSSNDIAEMENRPVREGGDEFPDQAATPTPAEPGGDAGEDTEAG